MPTADAQPWSIVITLPSGSLHRAGPTCTIRIPAGQRMLYLDMDNSSEAPPTATSRELMDHPVTGVPYRTVLGSPMSPLRLLSSSIAQFAPQRDLALIAANVSHSSYTVRREREPVGSRPTPSNPPSNARETERNSNLVGSRAS